MGQTKWAIDAAPPPTSTASLREESEKPADLPVQLSVKYETVLNMTTAKALGLDVPTSILLSADELIE
jgi:hypothetical protein